MNRKFVKENKKALKEFFIDILKNALSKKAISNMDKILDADPELKKESRNLSVKAEKRKENLLLRKYREVVIILLK